jgi:ABC-2 type transport system ATP-binding protein
VLEEKQKNGNNAVRIKLLHETNENELLSLIIPAVEVLSFKEIIPSMNDVFIKVVNEHKTQDHE